MTMEGFERADLDNFLYPRAGYNGRFTPENLAFNANLQEFAQKVALISGLHTGGKISSPDAFGKIDDLWYQLERSWKKLLSAQCEGREEEGS
jgi:hypothetical protein